MTDQRSRVSGTVYYDISGNTLTVGFHAATTMPGWVAWAVAPNGMIGANAIFSKSCGSGCTAAATDKLSGYSALMFTPSVIPFSNVKVGRTPDGQLAAVASLPWPSSQSSISVLLGTGSIARDGEPQIHYSVPRRYDLSKEGLIQI